MVRVRRPEPTRVGAGLLTCPGKIFHDSRVTSGYGALVLLPIPIEKFNGSLIKDSAEGLPSISLDLSEPKRHDSRTRTRF